MGGLGTAGALASEMESAALFTVAAARGVRCGAVFSALWNQEREKAGLDQDAVFDAEGPSLWGWKPCGG